MYFVLGSADVSESSGFCTSYCGWHNAMTVSGTTLLHTWFYTDLLGGHWATTYESLGNTTLSTPGAVSWGPGRVDVVMLGEGSAIWHKWFDGSSW